LRRCILILLVFFAGCAQKNEIEVQRSFYYWKSVYNLSAREKQVVDSLSIQKLYVKFFDVEWNAARSAALPIAQIIFKENPVTNIQLVPVVFITNEAIAKCTDDAIDSLAQNIARLVQETSAVNHLPPSREIQIDCDWTKTTKEKYFRLLRTIHGEEFFKEKTLSATIRLHQLKFLNETGVPPVDKGLIMCYNMGNLRDPGVKNSILETDLLKQYINHLKGYPLATDVALPIFDWWVWFRQNRFKGLVHSYTLPQGFAGRQKIIFEKDTVINGYTFEHNDWLRYEGTESVEIIEAAKIIRKKYTGSKINVVLYQLDEHFLNKYSLHEMENIYNSFH
jgi:hypothetical protein